jgi:hypothetical protein
MDVVSLENDLPVDESEDTTKEESVKPGAYYAVIVLTALNLLNFLDRYVPSSNKDVIKV